MKQRVLWSAVLIAALGLSGCGSAGGSKSADSGSSGKLVVWDWKSSDANAANYVAKAKADFAKKHPNVTVEFVAQPFDQYYTLLGSAIQAGKGPDVMLFNGGGQLRDRTDSLVALDEYLAADKTRLAGWEAFTKNSKIYAAPITLQGHPIYYNKALYEKAGLNPDKPADDLARVPQQLRHHLQGDRHEMPGDGQQGGLRHPVLHVELRPRDPQPAGVHRLDRRQAQLGVARRQEDLPAVEGGRRRRPEHRRSQLHRDVHGPCSGSSRAASPRTSSV